MSNASEVDVDAQSGALPWHERPIPWWWCVLGWIVSTALYVLIVELMGGPAGGDAPESIFSTWAIAHGHLSCMYAPASSQFAFASPLYPLLSAIPVAIIHPGSALAFPSNAALGHNCVNAINAMVGWGLKSGAVFPTLRVGYMGWLILMIGIVMFLRTTRRGGTAWEPITLLIAACLPPVVMTVQMFFHPQDLVAMGFALAALACARRDQWLASGVLVALAVVTHQYALLVAIPLFVIARGRNRWLLTGAAALTAIVIVTPVIAFNSGRSAFHDVFLGTGDSPGQGGTVLWELGLHGAPLVLLSRITPLVLSLVLAVLVVRRIGQRVLEPATLLCLIAVSLSLRLIFEQNIFGYYYIPLCVSLLLYDVVRGRIRGAFVAWNFLILLAYSEGAISIIMWRQSWGQDARHWIPPVVMIIAVLVIVDQLLRRRLAVETAVWGGVVICALLVWPVSSDPLRHQPVTWLWQVILVAIGVVLAAAPLLASVRAGPPDSTSLPEGEQVDGPSVTASAGLATP